MRELFHNLIDNIFDFPLEVRLFILHTENYIKCFFRKAKYPIGTKFYMYNKSHILTNYYKRYKENEIYYKVNTSDNSYSEDVIAYYMGFKNV